MSQTELGRKIDVTFQQVQKYENGTNRVGSGRLFKIASILGVPITAFFERAHQTASEDAGPSPVAMLAEPYVLRLLQAFCALEDMDLRRSLAELAEYMATEAFPPRQCHHGSDEQMFGAKEQDPHGGGGYKEAEKP